MTGAGFCANQTALLPPFQIISRSPPLLLCSMFGLQEQQRMPNPQQPNIRLSKTPDYREGYANCVQVRVSLWDLLLIFGRIQPQAADDVDGRNFHHIYLS